MSFRRAIFLAVWLSGLPPFAWSAQNGEAVPTFPADLPLVEVPSNGKSDRLAVFYSGDGGWAELDKGVSGQLAAAGVTVVGVNSLRYFWHRRSPDESAQDLIRILQFYLRDRPATEQVLLIGYSTGADVLPFIVNRLPDSLRNRIATVTLIAPSHEASFEIHVADWIPGSSTSGTPLLPEVDQLAPPLLCIWGEGDRSALCPDLPAARATAVLIGAGHHLGSEYEQIATRVLSFVANHLAGVTQDPVGRHAAEK